MIVPPVARVACKLRSGRGARAVAARYRRPDRKTPLLLVLGHESYGAIDAKIKSLMDGTTLPGHLPSLVASLASAVKASAGENGDLLTNAIRQNVIPNIAALKAASPILSEAVAQQRLKIVGAGLPPRRPSGRDGGVSGVMPRNAEKQLRPQILPCMLEFFRVDGGDSDACHKKDART